MNSLTTLFAIVAGAGGLFTIRSAIVSSWRGEAEAEERRATRLEVELKQDRKERQKLEAELAAERTKTDLTELIVRMQEQFAGLLSELKAGREETVAEIRGAILEAQLQTASALTEQAHILERVVKRQAA